MNHCAEPEFASLGTLKRLVDLAEYRHDPEYLSALDCMFKKIETGKSYDIAKHEWVQTMVPQPENPAAVLYKQHSALSFVRKIKSQRHLTRQLNTLRCDPRFKSLAGAFAEMLLADI